MTNISGRTVVSTQEANALKEMIFKRARERAEALNNDTQSSYTQSAQLDVMNLARDSFVANKNPFSLKVDNNTKAEETSGENDSREQEIGFARREVKEIKDQISSKNETIRNLITDKEREMIMANAKSAFTQNKQFVGALEFLNSQATLNLVQKKSQNFEALA